MISVKKERRTIDKVEVKKLSRGETKKQKGLLITNYYARFATAPFV